MMPSTDCPGIPGFEILERTVTGNPVAVYRARTRPGGQAATAQATAEKVR